MSSKFCRCGTKLRNPKNNRGKRKGRIFASGHNEMNGRSWRNTQGYKPKPGTPTKQYKDGVVPTPRPIDGTRPSVRQAFRPNVQNWNAAEGDL